MTLHPQYLTDNKGNKKAVLLPIKEYNLLLGELEELEDIKLYDEAKKNDTGERILLSDYLKKRNNKNA